ncbi:transposase [Deinococcus marmoris]
MSSTRSNGCTVACGTRGDIRQASPWALTEGSRRPNIWEKTGLPSGWGIEVTLSQRVRAFGLRNCRCRGLQKARLQHVLTALAISVVRLCD